MKFLFSISLAEPRNTAQWRNKGMTSQTGSSESTRREGKSHHCAPSATMPTRVGRHQRGGGSGGRLCCSAASHTSCAHVHASSIKSCALMQEDRKSEKGSGKISDGRNEMWVADLREKLSVWIESQQDIESKEICVCLIISLSRQCFVKVAPLKNMTKIISYFSVLASRPIRQLIGSTCGLYYSGQQASTAGHWVLWEDGVWPHTAERWSCHCLQNLIFIIPLH